MSLDFFFSGERQTGRQVDRQTLDILTPPVTCLDSSRKHLGTHRTGKGSKEGYPWVALIQVWEERLLEMAVAAQE